MDAYASSQESRHRADIARDNDYAHLTLRLATKGLDVEERHLQENGTLDRSTSFREYSHFPAQLTFVRGRHSQSSSKEEKKIGKYIHTNEKSFLRGNFFFFSLVL